MAFYSNLLVGHLFQDPRDPVQTFLPFLFISALPELKRTFSHHAEHEFVPKLGNSDIPLFYKTVLKYPAALLLG